MALVSSCVIASTAQASTATGFTGGLRLDFRAAEGEANQVHVNRDLTSDEAPDPEATALVFQDFGSPIVAGGDCVESERLPRYEVRCPVNPLVWVLLRDRNDLATAHTTEIRIRLDGGDGNDVLETGWANDELFGGRGEDGLIGDRGDDYLHGGDGRDSVNGEAGDNSASGGEGPDILHDGAGNSTLQGQEGDDRFYDSGGVDHIMGGPGNDRIHVDDPPRCGHFEPCRTGTRERFINCGPGRRDKIFIDPLDGDGFAGDDRGRVRNCERVTIMDGR